MATPNVSSLASYPQSTGDLSQRVALYGRVSTKDKGQEVQNQLRQLRNFTIQSGWTIVAEHVGHESVKASDRVERITVSKPTYYLALSTPAETPFNSLASKGSSLRLCVRNKPSAVVKIQ